MEHFWPRKKLLPAFWWKHVSVYVVYSLFNKWEYKTNTIYTPQKLSSENSLIKNQIWNFINQTWWINLLFIGTGIIKHHLSKNNKSVIVLCFEQCGKGHQSYLWCHPSSLLCMDCWLDCKPCCTIVYVTIM